MALKQDGMNFVHCPKQDIYLRNFFAKQGQGFKPLATLLYPNIGRVPLPPTPGIELELIIYCPLDAQLRHHRYPKLASENRCCITEIL